MSDAKREEWTKEDLLECIEMLVSQFAYCCDGPTGPMYTTAKLGALDFAFEILGWEDPHPCPEKKCEFKDCTQRATCGIPTPDGYKRVCSDHFNYYDQQKG
jgi:hypothetical protein